MSNYLVIGKKPTYHSIAIDVVDVTLACAETLSCRILDILNIELAVEMFVIEAKLCLIVWNLVR